MYKEKFVSCKVKCSELNGTYSSNLLFFFFLSRFQCFVILGICPTSASVTQLCKYGKYQAASFLLFKVHIKLQVSSAGHHHCHYSVSGSDWNPTL